MHAKKLLDSLCGNRGQHKRRQNHGVCHLDGGVRDMETSVSHWYTLSDRYYFIVFL